MTDEVHPKVAAVLEQTQRLQSVLDAQLAKMNSEKFTATDRFSTVRVTLTGHHRLDGVVIEDGLLRLGAQAVEDRLNEALQIATAAATQSIEADLRRLDSMVAEITSENPIT